MNNEPWPEDRRVEFEKLQCLLGLAASLNHTRGAIDRIQDVITLADELTRFDVTTLRPSFQSWLFAQSGGHGRGHGD